jgi:hypothetical protein
MLPLRILSLRESTRRALSCEIFDRILPHSRLGAGSSSLEFERLVLSGVASRASRNAALIARSQFAPARTVAIALEELVLEPEGAVIHTRMDLTVACP